VDAAALGHPSSATARGSVDSLTLHAELWGHNGSASGKSYGTATRRIARPPMELAALRAPADDDARRGGRCGARRALEDAAGTVLHRNFTTFVVGGDVPDTATLADGRRARVGAVAANAMREARWTGRRWEVLDGRKVNGTGSGFVEYRSRGPPGCGPADVAGATFLVEASAKRLLGKDRDTTAGPGGDYMRGGGLHDPGKNPNAYPMTGATKYPSAVTVRIAGADPVRVELSDDPADSRGILSWHAQPKGDPKRRRLYEAGSYGELVRVPLSAAAVARAARDGAVTVRLEVDDALPGGLAIYGREFGRHPLDPTVLFVLHGGASRD
jgi:hypothetical protein